MSLSSAEVELLENQAFNLMGRLHVILRREIGRVTDIKYMASNPEYCAHVLGLASRVSNPQLQEITERLGDIYFGVNGLFGEPNFRLAKPAVYRPLNQSASTAQSLAEKAISSQEGHDHTDEIDPSYVGRLR